MYSCASLAEARGCPIRKFTDQSLFAAPRNLSQRTTSFIASQCQGIHQMLLSRLITLIINVHPFAWHRIIAKVENTFASDPRCPTSADWTDGHRRSLERLIQSCINCASICLSRARSSVPCPARRRHTNKSLHSRCQSAFAHAFPAAKLVSKAGQADPGVFIMDGLLGWWRQTGSNRRPEACKATALPTELCPQLEIPPLRHAPGTIQSWWA